MAQETVLIDVKVDTQKASKELADSIKNVANLRKENLLLNTILKNSTDAFGDLKTAIEKGALSRERYGHLLNDEVNVEANLAQTLAENNSELETNNRLIKSKTALLQAANIQQVSNNETLDEQRQKLNTLQKAFASLSSEQKTSSATGLELAKQIKQVSDSVKAQEAAIGDNRRNVGNYTESIIDAANKMGGFGKSVTGAVSGIKEFGNNLAVLAKTPLLLVITLIVKAFTQLSDKLKESQEFTNAFKTSVAALQPLMDTMTITLNKIVAALAKSLDFVTKLLTKIPGINEAIQEAIAIEQAAQKNERNSILNIGKIAELEERISELRKTAYDPKNTKDARLAAVRELMKEEKALANLKKQEQEAELEYIIRRNKDTVTKRGVTAEEFNNDPTKGLNNEELKEYEEVRARVIRANVEYNNQLVAISKLEGRLLQQISKEETERANTQEERIKNMAEEMHARGEAWQQEYEENKKLQEKEYNELLADYNQRRELLAKYDLFQKQALREELETFEFVEKECLLNEQETQDARKNLIKAKTEEITKLLKDEEAQQFKNQTEDLLQQLEARQIGEQEFIDNFVQMWGDAWDNITQRAEESNVEMLEKITHALQEYAESAAATLASVSEIMSNVEAKELKEYKKANKQKQNALDERLQKGLISQKEYDRQTDALNTDLANKEYELELAAAKRAKAMAIFQIIIDTAAAIMKTWAEVGFPGAIATTAVISTLSALQLAAVASEPLPEKGFAAGGIVPGTSYTGDNVTANVNSGEMILNKQQQTELFNIANGNNANSAALIGQMFAEAINNMPQPILNYKEFTNFQKRVTTLKEL